MLLRCRPEGMLGTVAAFGAVVLAIGMVAHRPAGARSPDAPAAQTVKTATAEPRNDDPPPKDRRAAEIIVWAVGQAGGRGVEPFRGFAAIDPETAKWRPIYRGLDMGAGPVSPDGRYLAYSSPAEDRPADMTGIWVYDMSGRTARPRRIFDRKGEPFWVNEGRQIVIGTWTSRNWGRFETWRVNADGSGPTRLPIPEGDLVLDCSRDGTWLATRTLGGDPRHLGRLTLVHPDGTGTRHLTEGSAKDDVFSIFQISPDGRSVAYVEITTVDKVRHTKLFVVDIEGRQRRRIPTHFEPGTTVTVCWSPDGSRLALNPINARNRECSIVLVDLDGPNYHYRKLPLPPDLWDIQVCDWKRLTPELRGGALDGKRQ